MTWNELLVEMQLNNDIEVTLIKPLRKPMFEGDTCFTHGNLTGFKCGLWGGGHSNWKNGVSHSFNGLNRHWIKKPKVHITYNAFQYQGKEYSDWVDVDNCTFKIKDHDSK
jgi:hypothetical protein